jgi:hypothetical protein
MNDEPVHKSTYIEVASDDKKRQLIGRIAVVTHKIENVTRSQPENQERLKTEKRHPIRDLGLGLLVGLTQT